VPAVRQALAGEPDRSIAMGLYIHIPFCRKRCRFCYFRVYTNQNAQAIENYVQALEHEFQMLSRPARRGRTAASVRLFRRRNAVVLECAQLRSLHDRTQRILSWQTAEEVTFECEAGTLSLEKVKMLKEIGVTRVSLGVENFDDAILENTAGPLVSRDLSCVRLAAAGRVPANQYRPHRRHDGRER